jgi:radical SAM PhpK family P-methyltransferase
MADCLLLGFYDPDLPNFIKRVRQMGAGTGAYKDLALSFVQSRGRPMRALEAFDGFRREQGEGLSDPPLHNADFFWPCLLVLGTALHRRGHSFDYVNLPGFQSEAFVEKLRDPTLRLVAITTTLYVTPEPILELVSLIKSHNPSVLIAIGGPYVAGQGATLDEVALEGEFHYLGGDIYVISSEGEMALASVLDKLKSGESLASVPNIAYKSGRRFIRTRVEKEYNDLESNRIDYDLFRKQDFNRFMNVRTAKSCPFSCAFCGFPERAGDYTYLSVDSVEQELERIASLGIDTLYIIDDTFNVPKGRFKQILRMMRARNFGIKWHGFYRCDHGDHETIDLMAEAGCEGVILGVESGSDRMLTLMNKAAKRHHYLDAIPRLEGAGIACYASLIVGFPGETLESVEESMSLLEESKPSYYRAQLWYNDPITPIYRDRERHGLRGEGFNWSHNTMTVEEACDHIDRMLLSVDGSIWMPQFGFEFWSTFYLRRNGLSKARVDDYLRAFNSGVADKLMRASREELSPSRTAAIRARSTLSGEASRSRAEAEEAPHHDARAFRRYEQSWRDQFATPLPRLRLTPALDAWTKASVFGSRAGGAVPPMDPSRSGPVPFEGPGASPRSVIQAISAFLISIWREHQVDELGALVLGPSQERPAPARLSIRGDLDLERLAAELESYCFRPAHDLDVGLALLSNPTRLRYLGCAPPGFRITVLPESDPDLAIANTFADHTQLTGEIAYCLLLGAAGGLERLEIATRLGASTTQRLARDMGTVWHALWRAHNVLDAIRDLPALAANPDERESFRFGAL